MPSGQLLFFVDEANACVKVLAVSTSASTCSSSSLTPTDCNTPSSGSNNKPVPVYRSPKDGVPRAVEFVRGAGPQVLLVVEALLTSVPRGEQ